MFTEKEKKRLDLLRRMYTQDWYEANEIIENVPFLLALVNKLEIELKMAHHRLQNKSNASDLNVWGSRFEGKR